MAVSDREFSSLVNTVTENSRRIRELERAQDEARGAAHEGAKYASRLVALVGILGMLGQLAIQLGGRHLSSIVGAHTISGWLF